MEHKRNLHGHYRCHCCGFYTLSEPGAWEVCPVCGWEDDPAQFRDPHREGGANPYSLMQAREHFRQHGKSDPDLVASLREPKSDEIGD